MKKKEVQQSVIVRTKRDHVQDCYLFMTNKYNIGRSSVMPEYVDPDYLADSIEVCPHVGGALTVRLNTIVCGSDFEYPIIESVYFESGLVCEINIDSEFSSCRASSRTDNTTKA